jgi:hypothetical protein
MTYPWGDSRRFNSYHRFLQQQFGERVQKLTLDAGFTCPNRDGSVGTGGCTYCLNDAFNPSYCSATKPVEQQIEEGIAFHRNHYHGKTYLAYFQAYSNTYAPLERLRDIYRPAIEHPQVKGIVIGTRPDCVDEAKLDFFAELQRRMFVSIEYGVESCHDETLRCINRGHSFECAAEAIRRTAERGIHCAAHFIYGLPGETPELWLDDLKKINALPLKSVKFHQLQIIKDTAMQREFESNPSDFHLFTKDEYIRFIVEITERLNPDFVIERFAGSVPPRFLLTSNWEGERYDVILHKIEKTMEELDTYQGKKI